jgi:hypothetical protein
MNDRERGIVLFALEFLQANLDNEVDEIFLESDKAVGDYPPTEDELGSLMTAIEFPVAQPVLVINEGGRPRNALSDARIAITVIDYDRDGADMEELTEVPQDDGTMSLAIVQDINLEPLSDHWADFVDWWEHYA